MTPGAASTRLRGALRDDAPALVAAALGAIWLLVELRTPDLAAQTYRAGLFARHGLAVWDNYWFAGHHVPGYSLVFPPLGSLLGTRVLGALSAVASALLFRRLAFRHFGPRARAGTLWFGVATVGDLMIGRLTYALGVTVALAALLALSHRRTAVATVLAIVTSAVSPVAGLFLALAGVASAITPKREDGGSRAPAPLLLTIAALATAGAMSLAFPEGGRQPFSQSAFVGALLYIAPLLVLLPRAERTLRAGVALYLLAVIASKVFDTPMGGNVSRLGALFAGPLLLCALWGRPTRPIATAAAVVSLLSLLVFQFNSPIREAHKGYDDPSLRAAYYAPVTAFLAAHPQPVGRLEVPFTLSHWDTNFLAQRFPLARGWERQLDTRYDGLFYSLPFTATRYEAWLASVGVRWVALPDVRLDPSSRREAALIRAGLPYLRPVMRSTHWTVYEFTRASALASGPAQVVAIGDQDVTLSVRAPGIIRLLVHWTPYWQVTDGAGCVSRAGDWTQIRARRAGRLRIAARFSLGRVLSRGERCT